MTEWEGDKTITGDAYIYLKIANNTRIYNQLFEWSNFAWNTFKILFWKDLERHKELVSEKRRMKNGKNKWNTVTCAQCLNMSYFVKEGVFEVEVDLSDDVRVEVEDEGLGLVWPFFYKTEEKMSHLTIIPENKRVINQPL